FIIYKSYSNAHDAEHSFPTRRSSDLMEGLLGNSDGNPDNDLRLADGTQLPPDTSPEVLHADFADSWRITNDQSFFTYDEGESTEDRKSTRLNSSHVSISYAVFCLTKK